MLIYRLNAIECSMLAHTIPECISPLLCLYFDGLTAVGIMSLCVHTVYIAQQHKYMLTYDESINLYKALVQIASFCLFMRYITLAESYVNKSSTMALFVLFPTNEKYFKHQNIEQHGKMLSLKENKNTQKKNKSKPHPKRFVPAQSISSKP